MATLVKSIQTLITYTSSERGKGFSDPDMFPFPSFIAIVEIGNEEVDSKEILFQSAALISNRRPFLPDNIMKYLKRLR